jgi:glycosyltransferase involved in cell wall biosynthesis/ubiquinone/menaquinone biosynthesis C-methylase UbiE
MEYELASQLVVMEKDHFFWDAKQAPIQILDIDIGKPIPEFLFLRENANHKWSNVICLVRAHTRPLGLINIRSGRPKITATEFAKMIWRSMKLQIVEYLLENGLPSVSELDASGLPDTGIPNHLLERQRLLEKAPSISVVIATRERHESIVTCLDSFSNIVYPNFELIIVDNTPTTDCTVNIINKFRDKIPHLIYACENLPGLSRARNCGLMHAHGEIVAFTDDDIVPDPYWLIELAKVFSIEKDVACVTGLILPLELETPAQILLEQFGGFSKGFSRCTFDSYDNRSTHPLYPYAAGIFGSGGNLAFKTSIIREIGGFDPALGAGSLSRSGEEFAVFLELITSGYKIVYEPNAMVYHSHPKDYSVLKKKIFGYGVGLTSFLTKYIVDDPKRLFEVACKIPLGFLYAINPKSLKNRRRNLNYPAELVLDEFIGMLFGPFAYLFSRLICWKADRIEKNFLKRTPEQLKEHYNIEIELANRLRKASREERKYLYNITYDELYRRVPHHPQVAKKASTEIRTQAVESQMRMLKHFLRSETTFLEIGAGDCSLSFEVAKFVKKVYAVDVSKEITKQYEWPRNFELFISDGFCIPVPDNNIDVSYSNNMIEHLHPEDAFEHFRSIHEVLVPGGKYICITPNQLCGPHDISKFFDEIARGLHLKEYTISELVESFEAVGFSKVRAFLSYKGFMLSPLLPCLQFIWIERILRRLPRQLSKRISRLLLGVKLIAIK